MQSGELFQKSEEFLYLLYVGQRSALEHPPSAFEHIVGPEAFRTNTTEHAEPGSDDVVRAKTIL